MCPDRKGVPQRALRVSKVRCMCLEGDFRGSVSARRCKQQTESLAIPRALNGIRDAVSLPTLYVIFFL